MGWLKKKRRQKVKNLRRKSHRNRWRWVLLTLVLWVAYLSLKGSLMLLAKMQLVLATPKGYGIMKGVGIGLLSLVIVLIYQRVRSFILKRRELHRKKRLAESLQGERRRKMAELLPSVDRHDYFISKNDYRRGNPKENYYRRTFLLRLFEAFENGCAKCGTQKEVMNLDHFFFSKNEGGCFVMKHKLGHLVNNAIPLCSHCNRKKSDKDFQQFFSSQELLQILSKNQEMTALINEELMLDASDRPRRKDLAS